MTADPDPLRTALLHLGDVPPPPGLADGALARARRTRRRTVAGAIAATVVAVAAAAAVPTLVLDGPDPAQAAAEAAAPAAGWVVTGYVSEPANAAAQYPPLVDVRVIPSGEFRTLDPASGSYAVSRWDEAIPSPDGRLLAVVRHNGDGQSLGIVAADRAGDPAAVRWTTARTPSDPVWSPDGRRIYFDGSFGSRAGQRDGPVTGYGTVIDTATLETRSVQLVSRQLGAAAGAGRAVFGPGGKGFAIPPGVNYVGSSTPVSTGTLTITDESGTTTATVDVGLATVPDQPFSPSGRLLATRVGGTPRFHVGGSTRVVDVATGAPVGTADGDVVGWADEEHYVVRIGSAVRLVELATGRTVVERELAGSDRVLTRVWFAPLVGAPPAGAVVL